MKREKPPHIEVVVTPRGLRPHTADDAEKMVGLTLGHTYELKPVTKRSWPQLKTYWKALGIVVRATGKWPNTEKLHRDIKLTLGYVEQTVNIDTGEVTICPDSIALDRMDHAEFCEFMNQAMELLTRKVGFDPLAFLSEAA
jgi:hypothetical protein